MIDLDELERLAKAATPGPWMGPRITDHWPPGWLGVYAAYEDAPSEAVPYYVIGVVGHVEDNDTETVENARFIVAVRNATPELVAELTRLRELEAASLAAEPWLEHAPCDSAVVHYVRWRAAVFACQKAKEDRG